MESLNNVAKKLGMTVSGLRKLVAKGEICYFQNGKRGRVKFKSEWVEDYISRHTHSPIDSSNSVSPSRKKKTTCVKMSEGGKHGFHWDLCV
jgi:hypothetical protein